MFFSYKKRPKWHKQQNFYVLLQMEDLEEITLNIGETYLDSFFAQLLSPQKEQFEHVILEVFPEYFQKKET